jgi:hypothetical protein
MREQSNELSFEGAFRAITEMCDRLDKKYDEQAELERSADHATHRDGSLAACLARKARHNSSYRGRGNAEPGSPTE